jgi:putative ABC transport system permease protein
MSFIALVFKNLWRQKTRTLLTLAGITIGITTILVLGAVSDGLKESFGGLAGTGEADFTIAEADVSDMILSEVDTALLDEVAAHPDVERVDGILFGIAPVAHSPFFFILGVEPDLESPAMSSAYEGREFETGEDEIMLGKIAADVMETGVGDTVTFFGRELQVVGLFQTGETTFDGGAMMPMDTLQDLMDAPDRVSLALVITQDGTDVAALTDEIEEEWAGELVTIMDVDEVSKVDQGFELIDGVAWMVSALAIVIGGIGVMNTLIISVFDRTREIGVLKALGWRKRSVVKMVLAEAILLGLVSVAVSAPLAIGATSALSLAPAVASLFEPLYTGSLFIRATVVALLVALVGGAYPAYRAANLSPVAALRYE